MLDWLREKRQTPGAIARFWRQVLVSAVNEELDRMAAIHGFQVFWLGFLARADSYEMGVPAVPLAELYSPEVWRRASSESRFISARRLKRSKANSRRAAAGGQPARRITMSFACRQSASPVLRRTWRSIPAWVEHSPITGIHLWFDRQITDSAACHAARSHHPVDVQQERRPLPATGRERLPRI